VIAVLPFQVGDDQNDLGRRPIPDAATRYGYHPSEAGAPQATLAALVVVFAGAVLLVGPSFVLRYTLPSRMVLGGEESGAADRAQTQSVSRSLGAPP
jgi:hypothetical protein